MGAYRDAADRLREHFHCAVVIIHHCGIELGVDGATEARMAARSGAVGIDYGLTSPGPLISLQGPGFPTPVAVVGV
jgi:hypothetical protein